MSRHKPQRPKRLFRQRPAPDAEPPKFPAELVEKLKKAREAIDPFQTYRMQLPGGGVYEVTGAELIATAESSVALAESIHRGDDPRTIAAKFRRLDSTFDPEAS
jgi:hypothetical protein